MNFSIKLLMTVSATSISTLTLTFLNNVCETHRRLSVNAWIHSYQRNIIHYRDSIRVIWFYIATDRNDVDCSKCHRRFILSRHQQLSISTILAFNSIMNHWQQILNNWMKRRRVDACSKITSDDKKRSFFQLSWINQTSDHPTSLKILLS